MYNFSESDLSILYQLTVNQIYRFFYYKTLSKNLAEDLTSDTFFIFIKKIKEKNDIEEPKKFIFGIAQNVFLRYLKQKYKDKEIISEEIIQNFGYIEEFIEDIDNKKTIEEIAEKYINKLPTKQKEILKLRLLEKNSLPQICQILNKDMSYVKTTQQRGLNSLRKLVECIP